MHTHPPTKEVVPGCSYCEQYGNVFAHVPSGAPPMHQLSEGSEVDLVLMHGRYIVTRLAGDHLEVQSVANRKFTFRVLYGEVAAVHRPYRADS